MSSDEMRARASERGVGYFTVWGLVLGMLTAIVWGVVQGAGDGSALFLAVRDLLLYGWIGVPVGALVGLIAEWTRPVRQRRMLNRRDGGRQG